MTNLQEYLAGTNPKDPNSKLSLRVVMDGQGAIWVGGVAGSNRTYTVQSKESTQVGRWRRLADIRAEPANRLEMVADPYPKTRGRVYRLVTPAQGDGTNVGPVILESPEPAEAATGDTVQFGVVASSDAPLRYQWLFNQVALPRATNAVLVLSNAQATNSGTYAATVSDRNGTESSGSALLVVAPLITLAPQSQVGRVGQPVTFLVEAVGAPPLQYQWFHNGQPLAGQTAPTLVLAGLQTDSGTYYVRVTHATPVGPASVASSTVSLTLMP